MGAHINEAGLFQSDKYPTTPTDDFVVVLAWSAGIVDGEGCISMTRSAAGVNRRVTESYQVRLRVRMTHEETIRRLWSTFGGTFKPQPANNPRTDKPSFLWACHDLKAVHVLVALVPYLLTKRAQAELAIRFHDLSTQFGPQRKWLAGRCPEALVTGRRALFRQLAELNRKGPVRREGATDGSA